MMKKLASAGIDRLGDMRQDDEADLLPSEKPSVSAASISVRRTEMKPARMISVR